MSVSAHPPAPRRVLAAPLEVSAWTRTSDIAVLVAADDLGRWLDSAEHPVERRAAVTAGGLVSQHDLERELAREGRDRWTMGREAFAERTREYESEARARVEAVLEQLGVELDIETFDSPEMGRAARTAFVRLYEEGRLRLVEEVVATCPRCDTVVDAVDCDSSATPASRLLVRLTPDPPGDDLEVWVAAPELLPGAVAVGVPAGHPAAGTKTDLPLAERMVPVVATEVDEPEVLVPAHDAKAWVIARGMGFSPVEVLDSEGVVRVAGALDGLSRFAARQAATELLDGEGLVADREAFEEVTWCCHGCGTMLVPRLGRHWFLSIEDLEASAADALREGPIEFYPSSAREQLIAMAGRRGPWCLSRQVWVGEPVPVSSCLDCGRQIVAVEAGDSCPTCMGTLVPDGDMLDPRFVAALWPLVTAGWPQERELSADATATVVVAGEDAIEPWVRPAVALGCALGGAVPFGHLAVLPSDEAGAGLTGETVADAVAHQGGLATGTLLRAFASPVLDLVRASLVAPPE